MPGPNDFHMVGDALFSGLQPPATATVDAPLADPRVDGRSATAKREKALNKVEAELQAEREAFEKEKAAFDAARKAGGIK